jgi:hypothetical protein
MKVFAFLAAILAMAFSSFADFTNTPENFSPHFSTNTQIIWQEPTNRLPESFWIYKRLPARPFLASVISNAFILASMQDKQIPKPSTNAFFINSFPCPECMGFTIFSIQPASTTISFFSTNQNLSTNNIPDAKTVTKRAFEYAARFGLNQNYLVPQNVYTASNASGREETVTNGICGRGIFLARQLDGIAFFSADNEGIGAEGFSVEFGSRGQIRSFSFAWPNLERDKDSPTASPQQIINCILAQKTVVLPNAGEETYFQRIKALANAKTFTITKITPYYSEGIFGEVPTNDVPPEFVTPIAELEAVADFGNSNANVKLLSPILSSEVIRLLKSKTK